MDEKIGDGNMPDENEDEIMTQKLINEEYKTWKKNAPFLYDCFLGTALEWPTLTTQWLPDVQNVPEKEWTTHRLLLGTHTSNDAPNYLQIAHVQLPKPVAPDAKDYDEDRGEIGGFGGGTSKKTPPTEVKFNIVQRINHGGEVNKARYQPQNPNIIATMCTDGRVMVWDRTKHPSVPTGQVSPQIELHGHTSEGFGLCWSPHDAGHLATGSEDQTVKTWDITKYSATDKTLKPEQTFTHHEAIVNDVQYHLVQRALIGSVSDDLTLQLIDIRKQGEKSVLKMVKAHDDAVNALAFCPTSEFILATGSADKTIGIWDVRMLTSKVHALIGHQDAVTSLAWNPAKDAVLGSAGYDRRILIWDLSRVGEEQTQEDAEDGPPELLFMHGGHTNRISDFSWNLNDPWFVCSAAEDNLIQVWHPANAIVGKDVADIPIEELEQ